MYYDPGRVKFVTFDWLNPKDIILFWTTKLRVLDLLLQEVTVSFYFSLRTSRMSDLDCEQKGPQK